MFQLKNSSLTRNSNEAGSNNALPNNFGNIRTLKEDFENYKSGQSKEISGEEFQPVGNTDSSSQGRPANPMPVQANLDYPSAKAGFAPPPTSKEPGKMPPADNYPTVQLNQSNGNNRESEKNPLPSPFGSETFFPEQPTFENVGEVLKENSQESRSSSPRRIGKVLFLFIILILLGGGLYWFFFLKNPLPTANQNIPQENTPAKKSEDNAPSGNLRQLSLDLSADKLANNLAIKRYAENFASTESEDKLIEIKIISEDGQLVPLEKLQEIFNFQIPQYLSQSEPGDYSLFMKKEDGAAKLGAAFKLSNMAQVAGPPLAEETSFISEFQPFYLDQAPAAASPVFSSSKYKNADIRYFNFPESSNLSFDYTIIPDNENGYFVFSTSKTSMRSILDYMSEK